MISFGVDVLGTLSEKLKQLTNEAKDHHSSFTDFLFSAGGGFLLGAVAGYAIKKVMKIAAVIIGLFVAVLAYLS